MSPKIFEYIKELESKGKIDPNCKMCKEVFYPRLETGAHFSDIFAPNHMAMTTCKSGKYNHCTCDTCF